MPTTTPVQKVSHEEFCTTQAVRGDGDSTVPRIEQYRAVGDDGTGRQRALIVTRCVDCGSTRYTDPTQS